MFTEPNNQSKSNINILHYTYNPQGINLSISKTKQLYNVFEYIHIISVSQIKINNLLSNQHYKEFNILKHV